MTGLTIPNSRMPAETADEQNIRLQKENMDLRRELARSQQSVAIHKVLLEYAPLLLQTA